MPRHPCGNNCAMPASVPWHRVGSGSFPAGEITAEWKTLWYWNNSLHSHNPAFCMWLWNTWIAKVLPVLPAADLRSFGGIPLPKAPALCSLPSAGSPPSVFRYRHNDWIRWSCNWHSWNEAAFQTVSRFLPFLLHPAWKSWYPQTDTSCQIDAASFSHRLC